MCVSEVCVFGQLFAHLPHDKKKYIYKKFFKKITQEEGLFNNCDPQMPCEDSKCIFWYV